MMKWDASLVCTYKGDGSVQGLRAQEISFILLREKVRCIYDL